MNKQKLSLAYEMIMFTLAIFSVALIWIQNDSLAVVDKLIWIIFVIDVSFRFLKSESKIEFIKKNPFDIIAIIPLDSIFRLARFARLFRIVRALAITKRYSGPFFEILKTNGLQKVVSFTAILVIVAAIPVMFVEPSVTNYYDALWWSVVTTTTVGYGDVIVETGLGRIIAIVLMVFGIGLLGMITGSIATYFIGDNKGDDPTINFLKSQLDRFDDLSNRELDSIIAILEKSKKHN